MTEAMGGRRHASCLEPICAWLDKTSPLLYYYISTSDDWPCKRATVQIHISSHDGVPIYLQIVNQVKYLVACGRMAAGEELPPIRTLAEQLLINPNTVARAYRELELAGVVAMRRTAGTYVSDTMSPLARRERLKIITQRVDALLTEARQMNIDRAALIELIQDRDETMQPAPAAASRNKEK